MARGYSPRIETRTKLSAALKGRPVSTETRAKLAAIKASTSWREKQSASHKGKVQSPETIAKRVAANTGKKRTPEQRLRIAASLKGKRRNPKQIAAMSGANSQCWKGGIVYAAKGYVFEYSPTHPHAINKRYVAQHRLVMEAQLGRYLEPWETVHHKNGIKDDNRPENLELWIGPHPPGQRASDVSQSVPTNKQSVEDASSIQGRLPIMEDEECPQKCPTCGQYIMPSLAELAARMPFLHLERLQGPFIWKFPPFDKEDEEKVRKLAKCLDS